MLGSKGQDMCLAPPGSHALSHYYSNKWLRRVLGVLTQMGTPVPSTGQEAISAGLAVRRLGEGIPRNL